MEIREYGEYDEQEIAALYDAVGWTAYTGDLPALRKGFRSSLLILAAYEGEKLLGLIRAVGDGHTVVLVQDILVHPQYQRKGIGTALLKEMLGRFRQVRQIELVTDDSEETKTFYRSAGFAELSELSCCGFMRR